MAVEILPLFDRIRGPFPHEFEEILRSDAQTKILLFPSEEPHAYPSMDDREIRPWLDEIAYKDVVGRGPEL